MICSACAVTYEGSHRCGETIEERELRAELARVQAQLVVERKRADRFELLTGTDMGWDDIAEAAGLDRNDWEWFQLRDAVADLKFEHDQNEARVKSAKALFLDMRDHNAMFCSRRDCDRPGCRDLRKWLGEP